MASLPLIFIDIGDAAKNGIRTAPGKQALAALSPLFRGDGGRARYILAEPTGDAQKPYRNAVLTSYVIEGCISEVDAAPTGGTFGLSYSGNSTGLTALAYNISATDLANALNANAAITTAGGVTVTKHGNFSYRILFTTVGAKSLIVSDPALLTPSSQVYVIRARTGTASVKEIQFLRVIQSPLAYTSSFTPESAGTVAVSTIQAGTTTKKEVQRLTIGEYAYDGTFLINAATKQKFTIACIANTAAKEVTRVLVIAPDVAGSAGGVAFKISNSSSRYLFWIDVNNATTPPTAGDGETLVEVDVATNASAQAIAAAIDADATALGFTAVTSQISATSWAVDITDAAFGTRTDALTMNAGFFTVSVTTQGTYGVLQSTGFIAADPNGSVGVWFNVSSAGTIPPEVAACDRVIAVTGVAANDTSATVASVLNTALDGDAEFVSTVSSSMVTVTAASAGDRDDAADTEDNPTGFTFTSLVDGLQATATVPWDATAAEIAGQLNLGLPDSSALKFLVAKNGNSWDIVFPNFGDQELITVDYSGVSFYTTYLADLSLNNDATLQRFADSGETSIEAVLEYSITPPSGDPITIYHQDHTVYADVIGNGTSGGVPVFGATPTGNETWVDQVNGSDTTGLVNRFDKPFATLGAAATAVEAYGVDSVINVRPGTTAYNEKNLLRTVHITWKAWGATVTYSGSSNGAIFDDSSTGLNTDSSATVIGGSWSRAGSGTSANLILIRNGSQITFRSSYGTATATAIDMDSGAVTLVDTSILNSGASANPVTMGGGTLRMYNAGLEANAGRDCIETTAAATLYSFRGSVANTLPDSGLTINGALDLEPTYVAI